MRIHFEDHGQDFLTWQLNNSGVVVDCAPYQARFWVGGLVEGHENLKAGDLVCFRNERGDALTLRYRVASIEPDLTPGEFSKRYPVGTACRYYPIAGDSEHRKTTIRSEAWALGHGAAVVKVDGIRGGVDINHLVMED